MFRFGFLVQSSLRLVGLGLSRRPMRREVAEGDKTVRLLMWLGI